MDNYYLKYIKYKNKYIELKQCINVGLIESIGKSVWWYIRNNDCTYEKLLQQIPHKVNAITYTDFVRTNTDHQHQQQKITVQHLYDRNFPVEFLYDRNFPFKELVDGGYRKTMQTDFLKLRSVEELIDANIELTDAGKTVIEAKEGLERKEAKEGLEKDESKKRKSILLKLIENGYFLISEFKKAGFSAKELKDMYDFLSLPDNIEISRAYTSQISYLPNFKNAGFTIKDLQDAGFTIRDLQNAGFTIRDLQDTGFTIRDLQDAGFTIKDL
jgi:hypothetical protein